MQRKKTIGKSSRKSTGKRPVQKKARRETIIEDFLMEDGFDEEDEDSVTDDTLEFLSLDDEMIESYHRAHAHGKGRDEAYGAYEDDEEEEAYGYEEEEAYGYEEEEDEDDEEYAYEEEDDEAYEDDEDDEAYEDEDDEEAYEYEEYEDDDGEYEYDEYEEEEDEEYEYEEDDEAYEYDEYEDDDDEYEYDEYDDEAYEYDRYEEDSVIVRIKDYLTQMSALDMVVAMLGIVVLAGVVLSGGLYLNARSVAKQVDAFASVGEEMAGISVIGESGLLAVSESAKLSGMIDLEEETPEEQEEKDEEGDQKGIEVTLNLTTIQSDLKVKFVNKATGKLIGGVPFEVEVSGKKTFTMKDDDKDGIIYQTGIAAGDYSVKILPFADTKYADYKLPASASSVTVKDTITYKKVDVVDEVKTEAEVNAAVEDTAQQNTVVESTLKDTVEWVESTKTPIGGEAAAYTEVNKKDIPDPWKLGSIGSAFVKLVNDNGEGIQTRGAESPATEDTPDGTNPGDTTGGDGTTGGDTGDGSGDGSNNGGTTTEPEKPTISLSTQNISLKKDASCPLTATVSTGGTVTWTTDNSSVATVSSDGTVTALSAGRATITATVDGFSDISASCTVEVTEDQKPVTTISLNTTSLALKKGGQGTLTASVSTGAQVTWTTSDGSVATVSGGTVTAVGTGSATITAAADGASATCTVTVSEDPKPTISLDATSIAMKKGESKTLKATVTPAGTGVAWSSDKTAVATVDNAGKVTAVGTGTASIVASVDDGRGGKVTASCAVTVSEDAAFSLNPASLELKKGEAKDIAVVSNVQIKAVTWGTDNAASVTVSGVGQNGATGRVTGVKEGNATLTVSITTTDNKETKLYCKVAVKGNYTKVTVTGAAQLAIGKTTTLTAVTEPKDGKITWSSSNDKIAKVDAKGVVTGVAEGQVEIKAACTDDTAVYAIHKLAVKKSVADGTTKLKDKDGNQMYYLDASGAYKEATYDDYNKYEKFFKMAASAYKYTGWQTIDGSVFFFDKNGNYVTGEQVIQGAKYNFGSDGRMSSGSGSMGIDVSKWNGNIDWNAVRNSGVSYVIIRCGYRGSSTGALIEDPKFRSNIKGAKAAGLKVGVYFFSQAVNEVEAVEEASMALALAGGYGLNYPIFLDVEPSGGRADGISRETRTAVCRAFCSTVQNSGVSAGIYANKTWFNEKINTGSLTGYKIWLAQYASAPTYTATRYDMWQYSSKGKVSGINGDVDMNISYLNY